MPIFSWSWREWPARENSSGDQRFRRPAGSHIPRKQWRPVRPVLTSAAQGGFALHTGEFLGIAHGVEPGDESVVDAQRQDGVDLAVPPDDQRGIAVDLRRLPYRRGETAQSGSQYTGHPVGSHDG